MLEGLLFRGYIEEMTRVLGLDPGKRRTGVAISDEAGVLAVPLRVIEARGRTALIREVLSIIEEYDVGEVVVGLPLNLDGTMGGRARDAERLAAALSRASGLSVRTWDERFSTTAVTRALIEAGVPGKGRKGVVDRNAAAYILQGYLDHRHGGSRGGAGQ